MGKKRTATQETAPWAAAQPLLRDVIGQVGSAAESGGLTVSPYEGQRVASLSDATMSGINSLSTPSANMPEVQAALKSALTMGDTYRDFDRIKATVADDVKANMASTFAGGGINSGLAQDTYARGLGDALAQVEYGAYNDAQARKMSALGMAPGIAQMGRSDALASIEAGGILERNAQDNINADMQQHYETENADLDALKTYASLAGGLGGLGGTGTSTTPVSFGETLGNIGSAAGGIGSLIGILSDRRLKENIVPLGDVYSYSYIWSPVRHVGVMADEHPEAVVGSWHGFDKINMELVK